MCGGWRPPRGRPGERLPSCPAVVPGGARFSFGWAVDSRCCPSCVWGCSGPGRVWVGGCRTVVGCPGVGWVWCGDGRPAVLGEADGRWCLGAVPGEAVAFASGRRSGGARPSSRWAADRRGGVRGRPGETVVSGWRPVVTGCGTGAGRPLTVSRGVRAGSTVAGWAATSAVRPPGERRAADTVSAARRDVRGPPPHAVTRSGEIRKPPVLLAEAVARIGTVVRPTRDRPSRGRPTASLAGVGGDT